jgi:hypothetical protein
MRISGFSLFGEESMEQKTVFATCLTAAGSLSLRTSGKQATEKQEMRLQGGYNVGIKRVKCRINHGISS